jgi:mannose-1-phosphate guanylyltransferase
LSRRSRPKQALELIGQRTMFQHAVDRIAPIFPPERILVVTSAEHVNQLQAQAPDLPAQSFIVEPLGRGTAPAIGLGAVHIQRRDPEGSMVVLTADHYIRRVERFRRLLLAADQVTRGDHLVTLGIEPDFPSTGYGYIKQGEQLSTVNGFPTFRVERFTEKPDGETAERMVASGRYAWNSGMFIWRVERIMAEFERQMPQFFEQLQEVETALGTPEADATLRHIWPQVTKETIDYGIMEGAEDVVVIPADIGWSDVGSWSSMHDIADADDQGNVVVGQHLGVDTQDTIIYGSERLIATIGLEGMVVVETDDAVLVCPQEREQEVREIVRRLREQGREELL